MDKKKFTFLFLFFCFKKTAEREKNNKLQVFIYCMAKVGILQVRVVKNVSFSQYWEQKRSSMIPLCVWVCVSEWGICWWLHFYGFNPNLLRLVLFRKLQSVCCLVATCSFVRSDKNICYLERMGSRAANSVSTQHIIVARLADVALHMNANNAKARTVKMKKKKKGTVIQMCGRCESPGETPGREAEFIPDGTDSHNSQSELPTCCLHPLQATGSLRMADDQPQIALSFSLVHHNILLS